MRITFSLILLLPILSRAQETVSTPSTQVSPQPKANPAPGRMSIKQEEEDFRRQAELEKRAFQEEEDKANVEFQKKRQQARKEFMESVAEKPAEEKERLQQDFGAKQREEWRVFQTDKNNKREAFHKTQREKLREFRAQIKKRRQASRAKRKKGQ